MPKVVMDRKERYEIIDGKVVHEGGSKLLALASSEGWSNGMLLCVCLAVARFIQAHGVSSEEVNLDGSEEISNN